MSVAVISFFVIVLSSVISCCCRHFVEQELLTLPQHLSSPLVFSEVRVTQSLVLCVCFVHRCLYFSFGHCVVCSSSIYGFWSPLWYLQTLFSLCHLQWTFHIFIFFYHLIEINLFSPWYSWTISNLALNNNHSLTHLLLRYVDQVFYKKKLCVFFHDPVSGTFTWISITKIIWNLYSRSGSTEGRSSWILNLIMFFGSGVIPLIFHHQGITEILLKVALSTINHFNFP